MFDFLRRPVETIGQASTPVSGPVNAPVGAPSVAVPAAVPEAKASAAGALLAFPATAGRAAPVRDTTTLAKAGFSGNPVGFRAVRLIAEAAAALPLVLQDRRQRFAEHPLLDLVARPNPAQGRAELFEALFGQILLTGDGFLEAVGGAGGGLPVELHVLRSDRTSVVPGHDGWPVAYDYVVAGRRHRFVVGDTSPVCHVKSFHPHDDHYGLSALQAAAQAIAVHNGASSWSLALLDNAARPSGALVYRGPDGAALSPDQFDRLAQEIDRQHSGAKNAGRPMLLDGGLDWKPMGFSPSDMEFQKTKEAAAREIAVAFGVPPMILGIPGDATYANYQEANRAFYRLTVLPLATRVATAVGDWLSDWAGEVLTLAPDLDQVPALAAERDAQWRRVASASFLSDAEKRALLGLPSLDAPASGPDRG